MPKRLHEIKNFHAGTITTPSSTDIPEDSAVYSLNIDSVAKDGVLIGSAYDTIIPVAASYGVSSTVAGSANVYQNTTGADILEVSSDSSFSNSGYIYFIAPNGSKQILYYDFKSSNKFNDLVGWNNVSSDITIPNGTTVYQYISSAVQADKIALINNNGTHNGVIYDDSDNKFKKIDDVYGATPTSSNLSATAETHSVIPTMINNNKELHIGMGKGASDIPKWIGVIPHGQYGGSAPSGLQLDDAQLKNPTVIPNFHKTVTYNGYIYGIEYGSHILYKLKISDYSLEEAKQIIPEDQPDLPQFSAMTLSSDNNLWLFSLHNKAYSNSGTEILGAWYKVSLSTLDVLIAGTATYTYSSAYADYGYNGVNGTRSSSTPWVVTDIIEIGDYMWFGGGVGITNKARIMSGKLWLANQQTSYFTAGEVVNVNRKSFLTSDGGTDNAGEWELGGSGQAHAIIPPICLVDPKHGTGSTTSSGNNEFCGVAMEWYLEDGTTSLSDKPIGKGLRGVSNTSVRAVGLAIMSVKYDQTSGAIKNWVTGAEDETEAETHGGRCLGVFSGSLTTFSVQNSSNANYTDIVQFTAYDHNTDYDSTAHRISTSTGSAKDIYNGVLITIANSSNHDYHVFSGKGVGRWMSLIGVSSTSGDFTARLESNVEIALQENSIASSLHENNKKYYYRVSFVYDGYQESPLSDFTDITSTGKQIQISLKIHASTNVSKRVTGVNLYMAEGLANTTNATGFYRYIHTFDVTESWDSVADLSNAPDWGAYYQKIYVHSSTIGASYEARTGISEILKDTIVNYSYSTSLNSQLFVAGCFHKKLDDASNYLFKSKPYNYDQFNYINDFLVLPFYPTAIASFNGRVYVFDENNMLRIEPNNLYIENESKGFGCLSSDSVVVTEYGMCFADKNSIYLHDGQRPIDISIAISRGSDESYQNIDFSYSPKITFNNKNKSFVVLFKSSAGTYLIWEYNIVKKRWDLQRPFSARDLSQVTAEPKGFTLGKNSEIIWNVGNAFYELYGDTEYRKKWDWKSKEITLGQGTQNKVFNNFSIVGLPTGSIGTGVNILLNGGSTTESINDGSTGYSNFIISPKSGKKIQWSFVNQSQSVDALGMVYRVKLLNSEQTS